MPRVSVIIPAYNAESYLAETLRSVIDQTYDDWEAVVADDRSTDRTVEIARSFGERFTVLQGNANEGPAAARNRALPHATGELIALLDADDLWMPDHLERMVTLYDASKARGARPGIVTSDARLLGPDGLLPQTYYELMGFPDAITIDRMLVSNQIFAGALFPRAALDEAGGFCREIFGTEDYDLWLRILELGYSARTIFEPLTVYRIGGASVSANLPRIARSLQLTYTRAIERGALTPRQQRLARRQLRLQRALEQVGTIAASRREGSLPFARILRVAPLVVRVAAENPDRWSAAARVLVGRGSPLSQVVK